MRIRLATSVPASRAGLTVRLATTPDVVRERRISAAFRLTPTCWVIRTAGMRTVSSAPPRPVRSPGALSATTIPIAPAFCTTLAFSVKVQVPRSTSAMLPRTAIRLALLRGVQARPSPVGWSITRINWPLTAVLLSGGPNEASPTSTLPAVLPAAGPLILKTDVGASASGTAAVTLGPFHDRPVPLTADAARSALTISTQDLLLRLSSR